jgi:hypothetical protein
MTEINLDELLGEKTLTFNYKGKKFTVQDLTIKDVLAMGVASKEEDRDIFETVTEQLCILLGCTKKDVEGIGMRAANRMVREAYNFFLGEEAEMKEMLDKEKKKEKV